MNKPNESDTPETDACWDDTSCNILDFARRLERERDQLRTQLTQRDEALKVAGGALVGLKAVCVDVLIPAVNQAIKAGHKMSTWSPEAVQWSKATSDTDSALRRIEELTKGEGP